MQTRKVPTWLSAILVIVCFAFLCYGLYFAGLLATYSPLMAATTIPGVLVYLVAIFYCAAGYKKDSAILFKIYCLLRCLSGLTIFALTVFGLFANTASVLNAVLQAINCVICLIFAFAKNLGKKNSFILYGVNFASNLIVATINIIASPNSWPLYIGPMVSLFVFGIMLYGKYADKDSRGTI